MTKKTYRVGVVGLGAVGTRMVENMQRHDRFEPVAGFDTSLAAREALTKRVPKISSTSEIEALLSRDDIDVLYISTPPKSHAEYVRHGISKGWKIFCEKPLGVDVADSRRLMEEMDGSGLGQAVNFVYSGAPAALHAQKLIKDGVIGEIIGAELDLRLSSWPRAFQSGAQWLSTRAEGGFVREMMSHYAYLTQVLLGKTSLNDKVLAHFEPNGGAENLMLTIWDTGKGKVTVSGVVGGNRSDVVSFRILGSKGCLLFDNWYSLFLESKAGTEQVLDLNQQSPAAAYQGQLDQLAFQFDDDKQRLATFSDALAVQKLIEKMVC